jgi:hypothetical protein
MHACVIYNATKSCARRLLGQHTCMHTDATDTSPCSAMQQASFPLLTAPLQTFPFRSCHFSGCCNTPPCCQDDPAAHDTVGLPVRLLHAPPVRLSSSADLLPAGFKRPHTLGSKAADLEVAHGLEEVRAAASLRVLLVLHLLLVDS